MIRAVRVVPMFFFALALALAPRARAADAKVVAEIEGHEKAFLAAYENGETKKMKSEIGKAVSLGEKNGLGSDGVMADVYVLAAICDVDVNDDAKAGVRDFVKALKIKPDILIPKGMATSGVKAAKKQAKMELGLLPKEGEAGTAVAGAPAAAPAAKPAEEAKSEPAPEKTEKGKVAEKEQEKQEKAQQEQKDKQERERQAKQEQEEAKAEQQAKQEQAKQQKELAQKEKADKANKAESDKQAADTRARIQQLEKDKADRDKQLADAKARIQQLEKDKADRDRQLTDAKARAPQLEKDKADRDKQLTDAKARIQQLEKDKADRDKQLADVRARNQQLDKQLADARAQGGKDREALDKIAHDKQVADAQARDAENKKRQEREQRERMFAGPEMPSRLSEALTCAVPDEAPLRTDLFVHCVARPNVKARSIIFYYRAGSAHYYSVPMERTAKGWYAAIVPGVRMVGKVLQYYAEALDGREAVVAKNGKESSPNILSLRAGVPHS
jgi:DNA repair exonuclease SbcCD ATPase subunit